MDIDGIFLRVSIPMARTVLVVSLNFLISIQYLQCSPVHARIVVHHNSFSLCLGCFCLKVMSKLLCRHELKTDLFYFNENINVKYDQEPFQQILFENVSPRRVIYLLQELDHARLVAHERKNNSCCME